MTSGPRSAPVSAIRGGTFPPERKKYRLEFDDTTWTMQGRGDGSELVVHWPDVGNLLGLMEDVASNELTPLFRRLATFWRTFRRKAPGPPRSTLRAA